MKPEGKAKREKKSECNDLLVRYNSLVKLHEKEISDLQIKINALSNSEEKFRKAYMASPDSINITRLSDGMYISINEGFTKIMGFNEEEALGKTTIEMNIWLIPGDRIKLVKKLKKNGEVRNFESSFVAKNGNIVHGLMSASLIDLEGTPHILSVTRDITERRKAEEALAYEKFLIDIIMDNLPDHIYFKDLKSRFIRITRDHARTFGLNDPHLAVGKTDFDFFTEEHARQAYEDEERIIQTGQGFTKEERLTWPDRADTWSMTTKMPLRDEAGRIIGTLGISRDITEKKHSEERLNLLANALRSINECVSITDMNDNVLFLNEAFLEVYGYSTGELTNEPIKFIRSKNNPPEVVNEILSATLKGGWHGELLNCRKDGSEFPVSLSTSIVRGAKDEPIALIGVANDISETKKTREALVQSEERFRSLTQTANDAIITTDNRGKILGWNHGAEKAFGYKENEALGNFLNLIIPDDYIVSHIKGMNRLESGGEKHVIGKTVELHGRKKDNTIFPIELSLSDWETTEGKFFTGIIRDITQRKRTELESQVFYEISHGIATTSNLDELLKLIHSLLTRVVYAENCFVALYDHNKNLFSFPYYVDKYDPKPLPISLGKSCTAYVFRTEKPLLLDNEIFERLLAMGEVELVGSNSPSWIGIPLQSPSGIIGVLVLQHYEKGNVYTEPDVKFLNSIGAQIAFAIERKIAEEEIRLKNDILQIINAEKDKFFSILAHDLRGPLSSFVEATRIITEEIQAMTLDEIKDITLSMKNDASNIYHLLENLLEWSRLKRNVMEFAKMKFNLNKKIIASIQPVSELAKKKKIEIVINVPENIEVSADEHMFDTVIRNLVSNAIKFTPSGGNITVSASMGKDHSTEISIRDTGIGVPPELKNKLFLLNEKTNRKGTDGEPSSGLGLLLCKEFIEKHNGRIWVESQEGKGSAFTFNIPGNGTRY